VKGDRGAGHQQIRGQRGTGGGRRGGRGVHEAGEEGAEGNGKREKRGQRGTRGGRRGGRKQDFQGGRKWEKRKNY